MASKSDKRAGMYWQGDRPFISVTKALSIIDKGFALQRWYGQQVYWAVAKNPSISEKDALYAPYVESRKAADRGSTVHSMIEAYKNNMPPESIPQQFAGYWRSFQKWVGDHSPNLVESERTVFNTKHGYAGTLDAIADIGGKRYIVDFKTNKDGNVYTEAHMQVSAYLNCDGITGIDGAVIVSLAEDGAYTHQVAKNGFYAFLNALELYTFINYAEIKALGWRKE